MKDGADVMNLEAHIEGPADSPYEQGVFLLTIRVPNGYPMEPPHLQFVTPIFHPNIDSDGRICLDTLKPQPQGSWSPASSLHTVLLSVRLLIGHPNAADGLSPVATELYKRDILKFKTVAAEHTRTHALKTSSASTDSSAVDKTDAPIVPPALQPVSTVTDGNAVDSSTAGATAEANLAGLKRPNSAVSSPGEGASVSLSLSESVSLAATIPTAVGASYTSPTGGDISTGGVRRVVRRRKEEGVCGEVVSTHRL